MTEAFTALFPILLVIALGHHLRARNWVDPAFWPAAEWLNYHLLFPALLLAGLAKAGMNGLPVAGIMQADAAAILVMAGGAILFKPILARRPFSLDGPAFTSLFQCVQRPNTYVGLALAAGLWGREGTVLAAVCIAVSVPLVNVTSVLALVRWGQTGSQGRPGLREAMGQVATNPLILSCLAGLALSLSGSGLIRPLAGFLDILAGASLGLGLLSVGSGLSYTALFRTGPVVLVAILAKMGALPLLTWMAGGTLGLEPLPLAVAVLFAALPASPASYVLAKRMGGDAELVASMLSAQLMAGIILLPLWFGVLTP